MKIRDKRQQEMNLMCAVIKCWKILQKAQQISHIKYVRPQIYHRNRHSSTNQYHTTTIDINFTVCLSLNLFVSMNSCKDTAATCAYKLDCYCN